VENCDSLIAEVSASSHGVGYEIALALSLDKPILCCYRKDRKISKMILCNNHRKIKVVCYEEMDDLLALLQEFLEKIIKDKCHRIAVTSVLSQFI